jgi:hypothetical protein
MSEMSPYQGTRLSSKVQEAGPVGLSTKEKEMKHAARKPSKKKATKPGRRFDFDFGTWISLNSLMYSLLRGMAHRFGSSRLRLIDVMRKLDEQLVKLLSLEAALKRSGSGKTGKAGKKK